MKRSCDGVLPDRKIQRYIDSTDKKDLVMYKST